MLAWIAIITSSLIGIITWIFIIQKLVRKEHGIRIILFLIPPKVITENFLLKKYIVENIPNDNPNILNLMKT